MLNKNNTELWITLLASLYLVAMATQVSASNGGGPVFEQGKGIFESNCVQCHQSSGAGLPPNIPALRDNDSLSELDLIVSRVHVGKGGMPAFPDLGAEQIAAVASYVRNAWTNAFGPVAAGEVEEILPTVEPARVEQTIWDGVYSKGQADSARLLYLGGCATCHGRRLNGAPDDPDMQPGPPLAGTTFLRDWNGRTLAALFELARTTMPVRNPGQFSDQQYIDIIAYMLSQGDAPAGNERLEPDMDVLEDIMIAPRPDN